MIDGQSRSKQSGWSSFGWITFQEVRNLQKNMVYYY